MDIYTLNNIINMIESNVEAQETFIEESNLSDVGVIYNTGILKGYNYCLSTIQTILEVEIQHQQEVNIDDEWQHDSYYDDNDCEEIKF